MEEPQQSKGEKTRQDILDESKKLFLAQGYAATTMRQIAQATGLTPAAIYNYFPSKDELFAALLRQTAPVEQIFALGELADTPEESLEHAFREMMAVTIRHQDYFQLALIDIQERGGEAVGALVPQFLPFAYKLYEKLVAMDATRRLQEVPFLVFTRTLISLLAGWALTEQISHFIKGIQPPDIDWAQTLADIFLHGLLNLPIKKGEQGRERRRADH